MNLLLAASLFRNWKFQGQKYNKESRWHDQKFAQKLEKWQRLNLGHFGKSVQSNEWNEIQHICFVASVFLTKKFSHFSLFLTTDASVETCPKLDNDESVAQYHYFNLGCFGKSNIFVDHCDLHFCRPWDAAVCQNIYSGEFCSRSCAKVTKFMFIPCLFGKSNIFLQL